MNSVLAIAGFGFVGQALYSALNKQGRSNCVIHDPPQKLDSFPKLIQCKIIFCCLPTPDKDGTQDFSYYEKFLDSLIKKEYTGIVVIKSTILYKNIEPYLDKLNIIENPEFLNQNSAEVDFLQQKKIVLGGRRDLAHEVATCYNDYFNLTNYTCEFCTVKEAIEIKYFHNIYHAYKVLFWNFVHEQCGNHRKIAKMYHDIVTDRNEMSQVAADGKLGFSGSCFPKDVAAFEEERPHELTKFMIEYNKKLRGTDD